MREWSNAVLLAFAKLPREQAPRSALVAPRRVCSQAIAKPIIRKNRLVNFQFESASSVSKKNDLIGSLREVGPRRGHLGISPLSMLFQNQNN